MKKFLSLNSWSWVSLFGYLEVVTLFIVILLMISSAPSAGLLYALFCILLGIIYLILPIILFILEICGIMIKNIIKNKIVLIIGITIHVFLMSYCLLCYILLNIGERRPFVFLF